MRMRLAVTVLMIVFMLGATGLLAGSLPSVESTWGVSSEAIAAPVTGEETLWLDLYSTSSDKPSVISQGILEEGKLYQITAEGTGSVWQSYQWDDPYGAYEEAPMYPSPQGDMTGRVGFDPCYVFAVIDALDYADWLPLPGFGSFLEVSTDEGFSWYDGVCMEDAYSPAHLYHFFLVGKNARAAFAIPDYQNTDNYGMFKIVIKPAPDADGDGIPDQWEKDGPEYGIDFDNDGTIDIRPTDYGADWQHKDIFIEIDYVNGQRPLDSAITDLEMAFAAAPVENPDHHDGIELTVLVDDNIGPIPILAIDDHWTEFSNEKSFWFGTVDERTNPMKVKAKQLFFHYCLFVNVLHWDVLDRNITGLGEMPGNDFVISTDSRTGTGADRYLQASAVMHELGHNLGLGHGGRDGINNKPNYLSIMTYQWLLVPNLPLDYSRAALNDLNESDLDEATGIALTNEYAGLPRIVVYSAILPGDVNYSVNTAVAGANMDWNMDGLINGTHIASNVNNYSSSGAYHTPSGELLKSYEDWSRIRYFYLDLNNYAASYHDGVTDDYEPAELEAIKAQLGRIHNVAVVAVEPPLGALYGSVDMEATVANLGGNDETVLATVYCNGTAVGSVQTNLPRLSVCKVTVPCDLTSIDEGERPLSIRLGEVAFENATYDNELVYGNVQVTSSAPNQAGISALEIGLIAVVLAAIILAVVMILRRGRKK